MHKRETRLETYRMADLLLREGRLDGVMYCGVPVVARNAFSLRMLRLACLAVVATVSDGGKC